MFWFGFWWGSFWFKNSVRFFEHWIVWFPLIAECSFGIIYFVCYFCGWNREEFSARFLPPVYQILHSLHRHLANGIDSPILSTPVFSFKPPPPNILTSSSFSVDIGRRVSMPSTYHPLLRFLSSFGGSFGERVQQILLFSNNPFPFPYSLHIHQTSTFFPMTGREVQNASCE